MKKIEIDWIMPDNENEHLQAIRAIGDQPNSLTVSIDPKRRAAREAEKNKKFKFSEGNPNASREEFGPGIAGETAYQIIKTGAECVLFIGEGSKTCGELSIGTIDIDARGQLDHFPFCGKDHAELLRKQLSKDRDELSSNTMGTNGFGRT